MQDTLKLAPNRPLHLGPTDAAKRMRISIKTLRHYEKRGLLAPRRTRMGWRVYEPDQLARLEQILAFKAMGFELAQIATLLDAAPDAMAAALAAQELHLKGEAKKLGEALDSVRDARRKLAVTLVEPTRAMAA